MNTGPRHRRLRLALLTGALIAGVLLAHSLVAYADPGAVASLRSPSGRGMLPPMSLAGPAPTRDPLRDDSFARRPVFIPGRHLAMPAAGRQDSPVTPRRDSPAPRLLFGLGGAFVVLGAALIAWQWRRGAPVPSAEATA
jgi:hypothetical protein